MKKLLTTIILLLMVIVMILTRPSLSSHKAAMLDAVKEYVDEKLSSTVGINFFGRVGSDVVLRTVDVLLETQLDLHDYYLFNTTSVTFDGEEQLLSVGVLGHVFTFDKELLREKLDPMLKGKAGDLRKAFDE